MQPHLQPVQIYETEGFVKDIEQYLNDHEVDALRHYLASNPISGEPMPGFPGLLILEWGKDRPIKISYTVSNDENQIFLVAVFGPDEQLPSPGSPAGKRAKALLKILKPLGIGGLAKALWEIFKDGGL